MTPYATHSAQWRISEASSKTPILSEVLWPSSITCYRPQLVSPSLAGVARCPCPFSESSLVLIALRRHCLVMFSHYLHVSLCFPRLSSFLRAFGYINIMYLPLDDRKIPPRASTSSIAACYALSDCHLLASASSPPSSTPHSISLAFEYTSIAALRGCFGDYLGVVLTRHRQDFAIAATLDLSWAFRLFDVAAPAAHRAASYQLAPPPSPLFPGTIGPPPTAFHASPNAFALQRALASFSEFTSRLRCDSRFYCDLTGFYPRYEAAGTPGPTPFLSKA